MKLNIFSLTLVIIGFSACSNDFDVTKGSVDVPIVYGIIDANEEFHYIRLEKAFVDEDVPATQLAQDPNNLYYDNATVSLVRLVKGERVVVVADRIDGNLEGLPRKEGAFASAPNILYKVNAAQLGLTEKDTCLLEISLGDDRFITSETIIVGEPNSNNPSESRKNLAFIENTVGSLTWTNLVKETITSGTLTINYREISNNQSVDKSIVWDIFKNYDLEKFDYNGTEFLSLLKANMTPDNNIQRLLLGMDYKLTAGGEEIKDYLKITNANLGITSSGEIPFYSNLSKGRGIFSSRSTIYINDINLTSPSIKSLKESEITRDLNFRN